MILLFIFFGYYSGANGTGRTNYPPLTRITRDVSDISGYCILPWKNGINNYTKLNCEQNCLLQAGTPVPTNEIVKVNCDPGFGPASNTQYDFYETCDEFYRASYDPMSYSDRTTCLTGGSWSERLPSCSSVPLIFLSNFAKSIEQS
ncbi:hypothetical protein O3M35_006860 [Rhynocoris fuscipes]|uniref:Sushi domain-containing protein n=1 Tax=Rhynocoris fuscipes TaxID=488301 RepID=A0AAW1DGC6_9HEMI